MVQVNVNKCVISLVTNAKQLLKSAHQRGATTAHNNTAVKGLHRTTNFFAENLKACHHQHKTVKSNTGWSSTSTIQVTSQHYEILTTGKGKKRPRHRLEDNIKMGLQEVRWRGMGWIALAQDSDRWWVLVNAVTPCFTKCGKFLDQLRTC